MKRAAPALAYLVVVAQLIVLMATAGDGVWLVAIGWLYFLGRVVPQITIEPGMIGIGLVTLLLFTVGVHVLGRRSYVAPRPELPAAWPWRWTVGMVALCVLLFASGLSTVGLLRSVLWLAKS